MLRIPVKHEVIGLRCKLDRISGDIQNLSFVLWSPSQMTVAEFDEYKADVDAILAENKKFRWTMALKLVGLVIVPFALWMGLAFGDFGKPVTSFSDKVLIFLQLPVLLLYLTSIIAFPRYTVPLLALFLIWITASIIVSNEKTASTSSPDAWTAAPAPEDPLHVRFTPFIVIFSIVLGFIGSYCRMTFPDSIYPYTKIR